ncbi:MAG TPA: N-methyl-L-tryptophan oxidase [Acidobacteriota bacterium]
MAQIFDAIVIGLGGMGSAAACRLALRGKRILGLEQYTPAHDKGSSHGKTRIIRQAYYEDPAYVPLLLRGYELWNQIEHDTRRKLLTITGGLMLGSPDGQVFAGSLRSATEHNLSHEILEASDIAKRFPPLTPPGGTVALYETQSGFLRPEDCVLAHLERAAGLGATLQFGEKVLAWQAHNDSVAVTTSAGSYQAQHLVVAPGAWAPEILSDLRLPLVVERHVLYWFDPMGGIEPFLPDRFPIFIWETEDGLQPYGFPAVDGPEGGVKTSFYRAPSIRLCTPDTIDRSVHENEIAQIRTAISRLIPSLNGALLDAVTCIYTNTPDKNFIVARHPWHSNVLIACGFSGHGFKFCSVVGEILADLVERGQTRHDIRLLAPERFNRPAVE